MASVDEIPVISASLRSHFETREKRNVINAICVITNEQRTWLRYDFQTRYSNSVVREINRLFGGKTRDILRDLITPRSTYIAKEINKATSKIGTDETVLFDFLSHMDTNTRVRVQLDYEQMFGTPLNIVIEAESSFNTKNALLGCLTACDDDHNIEEEAKIIKEISESAKNGDNTYIEILTRRSPSYIKKLCDFFYKTYNISIEEVINNETSGTFRTFLSNIVTPWTVFWAKRIHASVNDKKLNELARCFVMNDLQTFSSIAENYFELFNHSIYSDVMAVTSRTFSVVFSALLQLIPAHYRVNKRCFNPAECEKRDVDNAVEMKQVGQGEESEDGDEEKEIDKETQDDNKNNKEEGKEREKSAQKEKDENVYGKDEENEKDSGED